MIRALFNLFAAKPVEIDARTRRIIERQEQNRVQKRIYAERRVREIRAARAKFEGNTK